MQLVETKRVRHKKLKFRPYKAKKKFVIKYFLVILQSVSQMGNE